MRRNIDGTWQIETGFEAYAFSRAAGFDNGEHYVIRHAGYENPTYDEVSFAERDSQRPLVISRSLGEKALAGFKSMYLTGQTQEHITQQAALHIRRTMLRHILEADEIHITDQRIAAPT